MKMDVFRQNETSTPLTVWRLSLLSFIVAALTGFLYRMGLLVDLPAGLELANVRHAHSHLMFFNWICPPIMVLMYYAVQNGPMRQPDNRSLSICIYTMIGLGFLSYPFFLIYGYRPVAIGSAEIPLAAAVSGLIMITWYWFAILYFRERKEGDSRLEIQLFDGSLIALLISSMGAWAVSAAQYFDAAGTGALLTSAFTAFFLSVFTEGWVVLSVMGVLIMILKPELCQPSFSSWWYYGPVLFGAMLLFPYSLSRGMLTDGMLIAAWVGLLLAVAGLFIFLRLVSGALAGNGLIGKAILVFIILKAVFMLAAIVPDGIWPGQHGVRILYLHTLLLGLASAVIIEAFHGNRQPITRMAFILCVYVVLLTLAMISGLWPVRFSPPGLFYWVLTAAALPIIPAVILLYDTFIGLKNRPENVHSDPGQFGHLK